MRTLTDYFALSVIILILGAIFAIAGFIWGDRVKFLEHGLPFYLLFAIAGLVASFFTGIELLRRRFP